MTSLERTFQTNHFDPIPGLMDFPDLKPSFAETFDSNFHANRERLIEFLHFFDSYLREPICYHDRDESQAGKGSQPISQALVKHPALQIISGSIVCLHRKCLGLSKLESRYPAGWLAVEDI